MAQAPLLSPPPAHSPEEEPKTFKRFLQRLARNPYVIIAALLHLLLLLVFGGKVLFDGMKPKPTEFVSEPQADNNPPAPPPTPTPPEETQDIPTKTDTAPDVITVDNPDSSFSMETIVAPTPPEPPKPPDTPKTTAPTLGERLDKIRHFTDAWGKDGKGVSGKGRDTHAQFVCYVAQADGIDPASYHQMEGGNIVRGPIPNLLRMVNAWSAKRISAETVGHPLVISSGELMEKKPPFIYFAGFADFVLTDVEVAKLHEYLVNGGAIWGDNGLAGRGSRFDIAFRREMKRVIPDVDKPFEPLPLDHPLFKESFYTINQVPAGMNFRDEPVEAIKLDGEIVILYTMNDYTDMMTMGFEPPIKERGNILANKDQENGQTIWITERMVLFNGNRTTYFRNYEVTSGEDAFRLGINIIVHLLTRYQEKLLFTQ